LALAVAHEVVEALPEAEDPSVQVDEVLPEGEDHSVEVGGLPEAVRAEGFLLDGEAQEVPLEAAADSNRRWSRCHFSFVLHVVLQAWFRRWMGRYGGQIPGKKRVQPGWIREPTGTVTTRRGNSWKIC